MARILIIPADALTKVGERPERGAGGLQNATVKRVLQRIVRGEIVVERGDHRRRSAEAILAAFDARRLSEATEPSSDHCPWFEAIRKAHARLKFVPITLNSGAGLAVDPREALHAVHLE